MTAPKLAILLSTFNGEQYLAEQLDSLFAQSMQDFVLLVRDDGSSDATLEILHSYAARYPERIHIIDTSNSNLGASISFSCLIEYTLQYRETLGLQSAYLMFCDQDDVWVRDKIEKQWQLMQESEAANPGKPLMLHSDLRVVDAAGNLVAESLAAYQGLETQRNSFHQVVLSNLVTGCTAFINEQLARMAVPVSKQAMMHDWWLSLVATALGKVVFSAEPLVLYRQHGRNVIGARRKYDDGLRNASFWKRVVEPKANPHLFDVARQARAFLVTFRRQLSAGQRMSLRAAGYMRVRIGLVQRLIFKLLRKF